MDLAELQVALPARGDVPDHHLDRGALGVLEGRGGDLHLADAAVEPDDRFLRALHHLPGPGAAQALAHHPVAIRVEDLPGGPALDLVRRGRPQQAQAFVVHQLQAVGAVDPDGVGGQLGQVAEAALALLQGQLEVAALPQVAAQLQQDAGHHGQPQQHQGDPGTDRQQVAAPGTLLLPGQQVALLPGDGPQPRPDRGHAIALELGQDLPAGGLRIPPLQGEGGPQLLEPGGDQAGDGLDLARLGGRGRHQFPQPLKLPAGLADGPLVGVEAGGVPREQEAALGGLGLIESDECLLHGFQHRIGVAHAAGVIPELAGVLVGQQAAEHQHRHQGHQAEEESLDGKVHWNPARGGRFPACVERQ